MSEENGTYGISYNLFNYGYKELTQDAFICWLIKWAYYKGTGYEELKKCGRDFVNALFTKHGKNAPHNIDPDDVKIWMQNKSIDVLARIGDYVLLIEDKTGTGDHSDQLKKYYDIVSAGDSAARKVDEGNIIPIYLKTGNQSLCDKLRIEGSTEHKYRVFERKEFLDVITRCYKAHPIISDFYSHLMHKEEATNSYEKWREDSNENEEVNYWSSCEGFFRELENHLVVVNKDNSMVGFDEIKNTWEKSWSNGNPKGWGWGRVNNAAGGFFGFWWYFKTIESCKENVSIYLQLEIKHDKPEDGKLCFKVDAGELDKSLLSKIKWNCHSRILQAGNKLLRKPNVMRIGRWMTVAQWDVQCKDGHKQNPWLIFNNATGGPDIPATIKNFIEAQSILDRV